MALAVSGQTKQGQHDGLEVGDSHERSLPDLVNQLVRSNSPTLTGSKLLSRRLNVCCQAPSPSFGQTASDNIDQLLLLILRQLVNGLDHIGKSHVSHPP